MPLGVPIDAELLRAPVSGRSPPAEAPLAGAGGDGAAPADAAHGAAQRELAAGEWRIVLDQVT